MNENEKDAEWWERQAAAEEEWWKRRTEEQEEEFIRQDGLMYGGLIAIGIVMVQPFLTGGTEALDPPAKICVIAFSVAIPLLAALVVLNRQETYRRRMAKSLFVRIARTTALGTGFAGVVAGFWHILPIAGMAALVFGFIGMFVHSSGYVRVEKDDDAQAVQEGGEPES